ncbi:PHT1-13 [Symbiodinium natans]|uniref:PHT1-13 protein n=1 Tax=Symbiodinium natans TaxID=878477 RepID=A0A812Q406_9DINO|nr:PHT1-13 [Symbiodinium natans]
MPPRSRGSQERQSASNFVPAVGNFSVQYNFTSASIAVQVLSDPGYLGYALREEPRWAEDFTLATVFLGAMLGMLVMGRLGDLLGRASAMQVTLTLTVLGSLIPACALGGSNATYAVVCVGRLVLGLGVGGIYPLSAVSSAEGCEESAARGKHVGQAFFFQTFGQLAPYLVAMLLLGLLQPSTPAEWVPQLQFRLLFALGAARTLCVGLGPDWQGSFPFFPELRGAAPRLALGTGIVIHVRAEWLYCTACITGAAFILAPVLLTGCSGTRPALGETVGDLAGARYS